MKEVFYHKTSQGDVSITPELMGHVLIEVAARLTKKSGYSICDSLEDIVIQKQQALQVSKSKNRD